MADRHLVSASLIAAVKSGRIQKVAAQQPQRVRRLFSDAQVALATDWLVALDRLELLGPVRSLKWAKGAGELEEGIVAELWEVNDRRRFLELSVRVERDPDLAQQRLEAAVRTRGLEIDPLQQSKTSIVLMHLKVNAEFR
jgi:hypothetical protein